MPRVQLPSGAWVEYRDELTTLDRFAVEEALTVMVGANGKQQVSLGVLNDQRTRLLGRIVTDWSYPFPIPADMADLVDAKILIGELLSLRDYNQLVNAIQPLLDQLKDF